LLELEVDLLHPALPSLAEHPVDDLPAAPSRSTVLSTRRGRSSTYEAGGAPSGASKGLNRSSPGSGGRTGSSRPLAPVNRVNATACADGHTTGQYAVETARRSRLPAANAWAMWLSATRRRYRRPGSSASGCAWLVRCVRLRTP